MKINRLILFAVFGIFHLTAFIFTVVLDNNSNLLFKMVGWVPYFKWMTLFGLVLFIVDVLMARSAIRENNEEKEALTHELTTLRAKLEQSNSTTKS
jgi:hypothetical protein